jgi:Lamin Tail Domain
MAAHLHGKTWGVSVPHSLCSNEIPEQGAHKGSDQGSDQGPVKSPNQSATKAPAAPTKSPTKVPTRAPVNPNSLIVINEIMYDSDVPNDTNGEWFELYNRGTTDTVNLAGWTFKDPIITAQTFTINANLFIGPGQYRVLGQSTDTAMNGNVTVHYAYGTTTLSLSNSADTSS